MPPIQNFLYGDQEGFCLHFATATALMLRELGIPCRIATGYATGTHFKHRNMWVFYSNDAHAWVEVKLKGHGWVVFDTTPPEQISPENAPAGAEPKPFPTEEETQKYWDELEGKQQVAGEESFADLYGRVFGQTQGLLLVIVILLAILAGVGIVQKLERRKRRKDELEEDERVVHEERKYLAMYRKVCQVNSLPMLSGDTLLAHVNWLEERDQKPGFADELLRYHYDTTYRLSDVDKKIENDLIRLIKGWKL